MTLVTIRTGALGRLAAIVLLLLIASPFTAPFSTMYGTLDVSSSLVESAKDESAAMNMLPEPAAAHASVTWTPAAQWHTFLAVSLISLAQAHRILRL